MVVSRISTHYTAQTIFPGLLLAIVTWFSFFMDKIVQPPRTALTMTALLSQITLRVVISNHIPQTNQQTWIEGYQSALLIMNFIGVACWVIVLFLHQSILKHHAWEPISKHTVRAPRYLRTRGFVPVILKDLEEEGMKRQGILRMAAFADSEPDTNNLKLLVRQWHATATGSELSLIVDSSFQHPGDNSVTPQGEIQNHFGGIGMDLVGPKGNPVNSMKMPTDANNSKENAPTLRDTKLHEDVLHLTPQDIAFQDRINARRKTFENRGVDGPGPRLAMVIDKTMRVLYIVTLGVFSMVFWIMIQVEERI